MPSHAMQTSVGVAGFWMVLAGQSWFLVEIFFFLIILVGASVLVGLL
jgi:hypothetical protein